MLIGSNITAGVRGAPPAVDETCADCQRNEKRQPTAWGVKKSFRLAFPTRHCQTDQTENAPTTQTNQRESKRCVDPEREQKREREKENSGEAGHPHIQAGNPVACLSSSGAGAVTQSKRKQNHASKGEKNKKQQRKNNNRHR